MRLKAEHNNLGKRIQVAIPNVAEEMNDESLSLRSLPLVPLEYSTNFLPFLCPLSLLTKSLNATNARLLFAGIHGDAIANSKCLPTYKQTIESSKT